MSQDLQRTLEYTLGKEKKVGCRRTEADVAHTFKAGMYRTGGGMNAYDHGQSRSWNRGSGRGCEASCVRRELEDLTSRYAAGMLRKIVGMTIV